MQELKIKVRGLYTHPSDLADVPDGALSQADNVVIDHEDVAEPRRGFNRANSPFTASTDVAKKLASFQNYLFAHLTSNVLAYYTTKLDTNTANFTGSGSWTTVGSGSFTVTVTIASPAVVTAAAHNLAAGASVVLSTSGALPTGLTAGTLYYVIFPTTNTFQLAATPTGAAIITSGTQSGTHTLTYGYYAPPSGTKMRFVEASQNFYFTSSAGIYKMDAYNNIPQKAGAFKALDCQATISTAGTWLTSNFRTAYRVVWGYQDANNNLILGTPSQREAITNLSGANAAVSLSISIPAGVTTAWFYQVYRAAMTDNTNPAAPVEPSDEMGLVYEGNPLQADINARVVTVTDITGDSLRGAALYTNPSQQGITQSNDQPPMAYDMTVFRNVNFFANTTSKNRFFLSLLAAGGTNGVAAGDTITIGGVTYTAGATITGNTTSGSATISSLSSTSGLVVGDTVVGSGIPAGATISSINAGASSMVISATATATGSTVNLAIENVTNRKFSVTVVSTTPAISVGQAIALTSVSLIRVINRSTASTVYAYYLSGPNDLPGQILLEEVSIGGAAFNVTVSRPASWFPVLPTVGVTTANTSTNDRKLNGLYFSKTSQPEAVPIANYFVVGSANKKILRILPLRDSLFILKEDGVFRVSGLDTTTFRVDPFDATTDLLAPDSAVVMNNMIFALTTQGVASISESGVQVRSRPIEYDLLSLQGQNYSTLQTESFGVSYETERKYILFVPTLAADTTPTQAYVFNTFTNTWTRWPLAKTCGVVGLGDDKLYLGDAATAYVNQERKSFSYQDYVDYGFPATITAVSGTVLTMTNTDSIAVGDVIYQSSSAYSTVAAVDSVAGTVTTTLNGNFSVAAADVLKAISSKITWVPLTAGNPGLMKQFREMTALFKSDFTGNATLVFTSDLSPSQETETLTGTGIGTWGLFKWGNVSWGGTNTRRPIRVYVPLNKQRCSQLTISFQASTGYTKFQLNGLSLIGNVLSEKVAY